MFLHSLAYLFSVGLLRNKFQVTSFLLPSLWQHGIGKYNAPTAAENLKGEVCRNNFSDKFGGIRAKISYRSPQIGERIRSLKK